jgi:hypothetical protein
MLTISSIFSFTWMTAFENRKTGFIFRLGFARPVSTTKLVVVPTLYTIASAVILFLVPASLFCVMSATSLPLAGITVGIACVVACFVATVCSPTTTVGKFSSIAAVAIGLVISFVVFHAQHNDLGPWLLAVGKPGYFDFAWYHYVVCLTVSVIAVIVTIAAVERQRHGDDPQLARWVLARIEAFPYRRRALASSATRQFSSRVAAQYWYEMRRIGRIVFPLAVLSPLLLLVLVTIAPRMGASASNAADWKGAPGVWLAALFSCPLVYQLVGAEFALGLRRNQGTARLSLFDATRSMSNDQLIAIKLIVIAACSLIGWLWMGVIAGLHSALVGNWHVWARFGEVASRVIGDVPIYWWVAGACSAVLLYVCSTSIFLAIGFWIPKHPFYCLLGLAFMLLQTALAVCEHRLKWNLSLLRAGEGYVLAVAVVVVFVVSLRKAHAAGYLAKPFFVLTSCLWVVFVAVTIAVSYKVAPAISSQFAIPTPFLVAGFSLLLVPLASTVLAPLALASHRHT